MDLPRPKREEEKEENNFLYETCENPHQSFIVIFFCFFNTRMQAKLIAMPPYQICENMERGIMSENEEEE